jgi:ABC-type phosphate transport system permease subunit
MERKKEKKSQRTTMTINIVQNEFNTDFNPIDLYINFFLGIIIVIICSQINIVSHGNLHQRDKLVVVGPDCIVTKCL